MPLLANSFDGSNSIGQLFCHFLLPRMDSWLLLDGAMCAGRTLPDIMVKEGGILVAEVDVSQIVVEKLSSGICRTIFDGKI